MIISNKLYGPLRFKPVTDSEQLLIPGLPANTANLPNGFIIHQGLQSLRCNLHYFYLELQHASSISLQPLTNTFFKTKICLRNSIQLGFHKRKAALSSEEYIIYNGTAKHCNIEFRTDGIYEFLFIGYKARTLNDIAALSADIKQSIDTTAQVLKRRMVSGYITPQLTAILSDLFTQKHSSIFQNAYLDNKLFEYLIELLHTLDINPVTGEETNRIEEACRKAHKLILQDISKHHTVQELAALQNVNENYLKTGFRALYGTSLYDFLQTQRMNHARTLITTTQMPLKQICSLVGFEYTTNFITAFKTHFGYTPGSLRRDNNS